MSGLVDNAFIIAVVVPRLHEEIAQLKRDLGAYEEGMTEIIDECRSIGDAESVAYRCLDLIREIDTTPADDEEGYSPSWGFMRKREDEDDGA